MFDTGKKKETKPTEAVSGAEGPASSPHTFHSSPTNSTQSASDHHATPKTCADDPRSWVELLDRLGSLTQLAAVIHDGTALLRRHLDAECVLVVYAKGPRRLTAARSGDLTWEYPVELLTHAGQQRTCRENGVSAVLMNVERSQRWFLIAKGPATPDLSFLESDHLGFFRCALRAYAEAVTDDEPLSHDRGEKLSAQHQRLRTLFAEVVTRNPRVLDILALVETFADTDHPVLIQGPSGTGKELIALALHRHSRRIGKPYITENCAAVPDTLLEAEFFGVARGAFTGATTPRPGLFARADRGTLFLDEIGEMSLALQKKLLRVLQEKELRRVGSHRTEKVDIRLVSATNRPLDELVTTGGFRSDLYFRLNTVTLTLPPLRDRREDIELLVAYFIEQLNRSSRRRNGPHLAISPEALEVLKTYDWPGNIRELKNEVMRSAVLARDGVILLNHISEHIARKRRRARSRRFLLGTKSLIDFERETVGALIEEVMASVGGNKAACAKILGIPKTTLYRRMKRYGMDGDA